ncbi:zinc-dependent metalloprotease [Janibacter sp. GS2]|uniref:zinc-dependent metalloprotease n=1 Tax=Janibacter sp. GS2 TaxID=3442646 RepID=UPI003EBB9024
MPNYVDWTFAKTTGARLVPPGPDVGHDEAAEIVGEIRRLSRMAVDPVAATSHLTAPGDAPAALVVDRPTWIGVNADSMAALLDPALEAAAQRREKPPWGPAQAVGNKLTGAEAGGMLAFLSAKVLGQYDIAPQGTPALLLVAPNMVHTERELKVVPRDFRYWVCLHEETHRVQFTAVPWLREHVIASARGLATDLMPDQETVRERFEQMATNLPKVIGGEGQGLAELVITPEQREQMAKVTAVMSLLEGHADVVMDDVGPQHVPTVETIRSRFTQRRKGAGAVDRLLRRLLGLEAKMRQYRDGATFVRTVQHSVGVEGFNAVWTSPQTLPTPLEITDPSAWVRRVHG